MKLPQLKSRPARVTGEHDAGEQSTHWPFSGHRLIANSSNPTPPFGEASLTNSPTRNSVLGATGIAPVTRRSAPGTTEPSVEELRQQRLERRTELDEVTTETALPRHSAIGPQGQGAESLGSVYPSVEERNESASPTTTRLETTDVPLIELRDVTRSFPGDPEVQALKAVSLTVNKGEYISVVGHSGSGKSTMLNILGLLDRPTVGEYRIDGHLTGSLTETERAAVRALRIGFVFQAFHLMPRRTVLNNVLMPMAYAGVPRAERHDRAVEALERVGLSHRMNFMPGTLSGGERQRVAIARAVATRPSLLLADEPTGNLDQATANSVMDLFDELNADGLTLMVITHDAGVAARARRTLRINDGRVTEAGILLPELEVAQ